MNIKSYLFRISVLIFCALASVACLQESSTLTAAEEAEVRAEVEQAFDSLISAVKTLEVAPYLAHFDQQEFTAMLDGEVLLSFAEFEAMYTAQSPALKAYLSLEFDKVRVTVIDRDAAVLVNEFAETIVLASGDTLDISGAGAQVWVRKAASWKLINISGGIKSSS